MRALLTDLYQLTMVYGYWKMGLYAREAVFHLNFRKWPFQGGFALAAGLETAVEFLEDFRFLPEDLAYLESLKIFEPKFLEFLEKFEFGCDVDAMPEGTLVFPYEPILRVKGPLWQAQLLESPMLNMINFQTLIATKAARVCLAAHPDPVIEFGMRRAQGVDGAISASRAAYIGGCFATSNVIAGQKFGIPVRGTHAHSWIMAFDTERESFEAFAEVMPKGCIMLVDTYDSLEGVKHAIAVAKKKKGFVLEGVRLDSGDLADLSIAVREILDGEGFSKTKIMATNELDEYLINDLKQQGAKISLWGVGTNLVTGKDQPALDGVYKLSAIQDAKGKWVHRIKLSEQTAKVTNPGILQVRRFREGDVMYDELLGLEDPCTAIAIQDPNQQKVFEKGKDLLVRVFKRGKLVYRFPKLEEVQAHAKKELALLPAAMKRFTLPQLYFVGMEKKLYEKKIELIKQWRKK